MKKLKHISILLSFVAFLFYKESSKVYAQDVHFSQYMLTPLLLNPASAGAYSGEHRAFLNYKNQWNGMAERGAAYRTFMCSYDTRLKSKKQKKARIGVGFNAFRDVAGDLNIGTTQLNFSIAGIVNLNDKMLLSGGIQSGFVQKGLDASKMKWDSQYDKEIDGYNASLPSNDINNVPSRIYGDFSFGLAWTYNVKKSTNPYTNDQLLFHAGLSAFHLNRPNQKFKIYSDDFEALRTKFALYGDGYIGLGASGYQLVPSLLVAQQGPYREIVAGTMLRWVIRAESRYTGYVQGMAASVGIQYRANDAVIPMCLFEYSDFAMGVSYDVTTSSLAIGTRGRGGLELALRYVKSLGVSSTRLLD